MPSKPTISFRVGDMISLTIFKYTVYFLITGNQIRYKVISMSSSDASSYTTTKVNAKKYYKFQSDILRNEI